MTALEAAGVDGDWLDGDLGHGRAYTFLDPDGHRYELFYESERYEAPPELRPALKNQPQRYPGRGVGVRHLDHVNFLAVDPAENRVFARGMPRATADRADRARRRQRGGRLAHLRPEVV